MKTTPTRAILLAGVATLSLSVAGYASEFSNVFVFGDRQIDAGQAPDEFFFLVNGEQVSDGRRRWTNREDEGLNDSTFGNYGATWAMRVSENLGYGVGGPSQPSELHSGDFIFGSENYASHGYGSADVLNSITGQAITPDSEYVSTLNGEIETVAGRERAGLLRVCPESS